MANLLLTRNPKRKTGNKQKGLSDQKLSQRLAELRSQHGRELPAWPLAEAKPVAPANPNQTPAVSDPRKAQLEAKTHDYMCRITGVRDVGLAGILICKVEQGLSVIKFPKDPYDPARVDAAAAALEEMNLQNATECLLAVQMLGVHHAAISSLKAATSSQTIEACDSLSRQSVRLMRLFIEQVEAMSKLKGKTAQQKVIVEHVHIHQGGQAIVGAVSAAKATHGEGGQ